ncbi:transcriptional corepressor SEUSS-like [Impatiens glandulifera]|uniref:transcriptional corepressor SEUSS-like n=1 Tax=Impatiens glandulifera TaxID=253017 RepID=UPI001FB07095|nr:transcriptional corepressor SEUSS-like [Impatiens glandulifera]XP_047319827.1 transcriptional corepressor SEUSS-like [Impatiens glandulifera]
MVVPSGTPTPVGGPQSVPPSLLRSNSGLMGGGQGGGAQQAFPSLVSSRAMFNNVNMMGNVSNLLQQPFANGVPDSGISCPASSQRGVMDTGAETDPLSSIGNGIVFNNPSTSSQIQGQQFSSPSGNHIMSDQQQNQQPDMQNFQHNQQQMHQFTAPPNNTLQQQQYQQIRGVLGVPGPVKLEPQVNDLHIQQPPHQLHPMRTLGSVKLEPQQIQTMRGLASVKMEPQLSDQSLFLHQQQQQQQQQFIQMSRQSPQAAAQMLHQQRMLQFQQQQHQQQSLKSIPMQRSPAQPQFQPQNMPLRSPAKPSYEPGTCAKRLTHFICHQQRRPEDNNIEFWRKFVAEYFAPNAKKKWCVSMYGNGRQTTGVFPQDIWHCEICKRKPGRGFEATVEVLPRLFKIKYESGTLEELLYVDMPQEYQNSSGQIVLEYAKAVQESVFDQLRVVRDGQLRIVFSQDLKICSWEFCARRHEELLPRRILIPQVSQLGAAAQKYQVAAQNATSNLSVPELQNNCNMFVSSARQLAKALEVPLVNDLGYTKRYVRCLQISEVVNSMRDLIDYSRETQIGPIECLAKFPRRGSSSTPGFHQQQAQHKEEDLQQQQTHKSVAQNTNCGDQSNGIIPIVNNSSSTSSSSASTIVGLLHQNSMTRHQNPVNNNNNNTSNNNNNNNANAPHTYVPTGLQNPSSATIPPFQQPPPSSSQQTANVVNPALSGNTDQNDSQAIPSVQKIFQNVNGTGGNFLVPNGSTAGMMNGIRGVMGNNGVGRIREQSMINSQQQQQVLGEQIFNGIGSVNNGFGNVQFEWKS